MTDPYADYPTRLRDIFTDTRDAPVTYLDPILTVLADELTAIDGSYDPDLFRLYALLALVKGTETSLEDVHEAWAIWKLPINPEHKSLIPFDQLTEAVQQLDEPYMLAIHKAAGAR